MEKPKNIFVIGAQCTGKTTLVDALEKHFVSHPEGLMSAQQPTIIREVARSVLRIHGFSRDDITNSPERALQLQEKILDAQSEAECAATNDSNASWYIADRSGIDPIVYASVFVSEKASQKLFTSSTWTQLEKNMKAGLVVLCEAGWNFLQDDGTRLMPKDAADWDRVDLAFRKLLKECSVDFVVLPKGVQDREERLKAVLAAHRS